MRGSWTVVCLLVVTACSKSPAAPGPVDRQVTLAPGQTVLVSEASVNVRFEGVSGDSRCPLDAVCVWGGDALVRIEVLPAGGGRQPYDLHTGNMQPVRHDDLTIALVELAPYPFSATPIPPPDYRATLRLTR
jgi:hypothetical protein